MTDIELRAIAQGYGTFLNGAFGLPNKSPNNQVGDGVDSNADMPFLGTFPYIGLPHSGYESVPPLSPGPLAPPPASRLPRQRARSGSPGPRSSSYRSVSKTPSRGQVQA